MKTLGEQEAERVFRKHYTPINSDVAGAMMFETQWWAPMTGCDTMQELLEDFAHIIDTLHAQQRAELERQTKNVEDLGFNASTTAANNRALQAELEKERKLLRLEIEDECQTDTSIRDMIRPILGETKTDHDGYAVVPLETAVETVIAHLQAELEQARGEIAQIRHAAFPDGAPKGYNPDLSEAVKQVRQSSAQCAQRYAILSKTRERELDQHTQEREDLRARLATAEADTKRLDWFFAQLGPGNVAPMVELANLRHNFGGDWREAIDKAKVA